MDNPTFSVAALQGPFAGLGEALLRLRKTRGLSQADLADKAGVARASLSAYEAGKQVPSLESLNRLMVTLAVDLDELSLTLKSVRG
jgi:transcriptional regulator with XRE-family HTH domain